MKKVLGMIATGTGLVVCVILLGAVINIAVNRQDAHECLQWQAEAQEYTGFYLTQDQALQCMSQGIKIDAPVK